MVTVIFPAAGKGKRMQAGMNKVFMDLAGLPILVRTLLKFSACEAVDKLVVVVAEPEVAFVQQILQLVPGLKPWQVTAGGSERQYSVLNGIRCAGDEADIILVHDAARPLISRETILAVIEAVKAQGGAIAAVPAKNTIKLCNDQHQVVETPDRSKLWEVQTPQGFQRDILLRANAQAEQDKFLGTDDASLVERLGKPVYIVESDYRNIKITTPEDILIAEAFLAEDGVAEAMGEDFQTVGQVLRQAIEDNIQGAVN